MERNKTWDRTQVINITSPYACQWSQLRVLINKQLTNIIKENKNVSGSAREFSKEPIMASHEFIFSIVFVFLKIQ